jgi:ketosteroid isomerase-like protein
VKKRTLQGERHMKTSHTVAVLLATFLLFGQANAGDDPKVAAEVMALARAQWDAEVAGKSVAEQMAATADDYTEFNPDYPVRLDGKALNSRLWEATSSDGSRSLLGEMQNAKVQVYGDTAVLTYNFVGVNRDKDGKTSPNKAKSTRVYVRIGGKWMLVHANFSPVS